MIFIAEMMIGQNSFAVIERCEIQSQGSKRSGIAVETTSKRCKAQSQGSKEVAKRRQQEQLQQRFQECYYLGCKEGAGEWSKFVKNISPLFFFNKKVIDK